MTKTDKENLQNKKLTIPMIISCLATCESVISKNAYLEKKWSNYYVCANQSASAEYKIKRLEWMNYRAKLRELLLQVYSMKEIIQKTKSCTDKATQKEVKEVIEIIENDFVLL
ncbi:MAG: hypothetical protein IKW30_04470 [Lachnospiraceae bacterium]|nr:hypothetical protein [Lachnospiraceae bacterium]